MIHVTNSFVLLQMPANTICFSEEMRTRIGRLYVERVACVYNDRTSWIGPVNSSQLADVPEVLNHDAPNGHMPSFEEKAGN